MEIIPGVCFRDTNDLASYTFGCKLVFVVLFKIKVWELLWGAKEKKQEGMLEGKLEGKEETRAEDIKTMHSNGFDINTIAKALSLDINYVKLVLSK